MKAIKFIIVGVIFGIIMTKSEAISWFRMQEMFRFQAIHMYGIIGTAVVLGVIGVVLIKRFNVNDVYGKKIEFHPKKGNRKGALIGGVTFGLGWALVGACPGPMYTLLGNGYYPILIIIATALLGTFVYGLLRPKLPH